jgi:hypothetical protein
MYKIISFQWVCIYPLLTPPCHFRAAYSHKLPYSSCLPDGKRYLATTAHKSHCKVRAAYGSRLYDEKWHTDRLPDISVNRFIPRPAARVIVAPSK